MTDSTMALEAKRPKSHGEGGLDWFDMAAVRRLQDCRKSNKRTMQVHSWTAVTSVSERRVELIEVVPVELCYVSCNSSEAEAEREGHPSLLFLIALATDPPVYSPACTHVH